MDDSVYHATANREPLWRDLPEVDSLEFLAVGAKLSLMIADGELGALSKLPLLDTEILSYPLGCTLLLHWLLRNPGLM